MRFLCRVGIHKWKELTRSEKTDSYVASADRYGTEYVNEVESVSYSVTIVTANYQCQKCGVSKTEKWSVSDD